MASIETFLNNIPNNYPPKWKPPSVSQMITKAARNNEEARDIINRMDAAAKNGKIMIDIDKRPGLNTEIILQKLGFTVQEMNTGKFRIHV